MKVIGYARISRTKDDSSTIPKQEAIIRKTAEARGWDVVDIIADEDQSATKTRLDRPGLTEVRRRIHSGEADALLCWRLDRVARSVVDFGILLDEGLHIVSATEPLDTTSPIGRAMVEIILVFAALESRTTGERARATKAFLKSRGRWGGGPRPYGYEPVPADDGVGKVLEVVPAERDVVRRIFRDLDAGLGVYTIAQALNREGIPTATGRGIWKPASVLNVARSWHVSGYLTEAAQTDAQGRPIGRARRPVLGPDGEPMRPWEPLVEDDLAERVRAKVTPEALDEARSAATKRGLNGETRRMLSGLAYCRCGERLLVKTRKGRAFYGCRGLGEGPHVLADAEAVEAEAERQALELYGSVRVTERHVEKTPVGEALAEIEKDLAVLAGEITRPGADVPTLAARISALSEERDRLEATEDRVIRRERTETYGDVWDSWSAGEKRSALEILGVCVTVRAAARRGSWDPSRVVLTGEHEYTHEEDYGLGESRGPQR